ncbi:hypothetical protein [Metabacillus litoralis]|uniref:hypothetical protein n=1 Tax=Metabacillus litoralis TaxID=152268 RepID=UPI00131541AC|nr:hypothetical protein [Metabacillus litoralis]
MKIRKEKRYDRRGIVKDILIEFRDSIVFEVFWNILMFIPRILFRVIKNMFN